jgi:hypothetical protein
VCQNSIREFNELKPTEAGFEAKVGVNNNLVPVNGQNAEAARLRNLEDRTADAGICPNGFQIVDRSVLQRLGYGYWIRYQGKCL